MFFDLIEFRAAVTQNNEKMIQFLLQLGAHPDVIDFAGRTAVMYAAQFGHVNALQLLREAKANARIQDLEGRGSKTKEGFFFNNKSFL